MYIGGEEGVSLSSGFFLFSYYTNCVSINGMNLLHTGNVENMGVMFLNCNAITELDL